MQAAEPQERLKGDMVVGFAPKAFLKWWPWSRRIDMGRIGSREECPFDYIGG
jgi:hypothetical protein